MEHKNPLYEAVKVVDTKELFKQVEEHQAAHKGMTYYKALMDVSNRVLEENKTVLKLAEIIEGIPEEQLRKNAVDALL